MEKELLIKLWSLAQEAAKKGLTPKTLHTVEWAWVDEAPEVEDVFLTKEEAEEHLVSIGGKVDDPNLPLTFSDHTEKADVTYYLSVGVIELR